MINNPIVIGNSDLQAEKMKMLEYTLDYHLSDSWQFSLGLFSYTADKMIDFFNVVDDVNPAMNLNKQTGKGVEFETIYKYDDTWYGTFSWAWQDIRDEKTDAFIHDVPKQSAKFSLNWRITDSIDWRIDGNWVASRHRNIADARPPVDDFLWFNSALVYQFNSQLTLKLMMRNLLNDDARAPSRETIANDLPLESRGTWLNVKYQF